VPLEQRFELGKTIGSGNLSVLHQGKDLHDGRLVAVKKLDMSKLRAADLASVFSCKVFPQRTLKENSERQGSRLAGRAKAAAAARSSGAGAGATSQEQLRRSSCSCARRSR
jgi:hypothetical protein